MSRTAIAGAAAILAAKRLAPHLLKSSGTDVGKVSGGQLAEAIANGDEKIEMLVRNRCHILGVALSNIVDFLNPEMVVLGGGLTKAMAKIVRDEVEMGIRSHSSPQAARGLRVKVGKLKDHAVTIGAAKLALEVGTSGSAGIAKGKRRTHS